MKLRWMFVALAVFVSQPAVAQEEETVKVLFEEGQRAYGAGDVETARQKFQTVVEIDPRHPGAVNYLRTLNARQTQGGSSGRQSHLGGVVLPEVKFRDASLESALEFLKQITEQQLGPDVPVNFVSQAPPDVLAQKVTLDLRNIPFTDVLRYLGEMAGVTFRIERHAIVMRPQAAPAPAATAE